MDTMTLTQLEDLAADQSQEAFAAATDRTMPAHLAEMIARNAACTYQTLLAARAAESVS